MDCGEFRSWLCSGEPNAAQAAARHRAACPRCRTLAAEDARIARLLQASRYPTSATPDSEAAVDRALAALPLPAPWTVRLRERLVSSPRGWAAGAFAAAAVIAAVILIRPNGGGGTVQREAGVPGRMPAVRQPPDGSPGKEQSPDAQPRTASAAVHQKAPAPAGRDGARLHPTPAVHGPLRRVANGPSVSPERHPLGDQPDSSYLDGWDPRLMAQWAGRDRAGRLGLAAALQRPLPAVKDDFVYVPLPQLATADGKAPAVGDAVKQYEKEAAIVDARLFQGVTVELKAVSLSEFCELLARQTGVRLTAARGVAQENVTVLVQERPARDVMREVARLFGYRWARSGEEGRYRYELYQDLRSQLAEQEMRDRDLRSALLAMDARMDAYGEYLGLTPEQVAQRYNEAQGARKELLRGALGPQWSAVQLYHRLSPAERSLLAQGQTLQFTSHSPQPDRRIPEEWLRPFLSAWDMGVTQDPVSGRIGFGPVRYLQQQGTPYTPLADHPEANAIIRLSMDHSELGQVSLHSEAEFDIAGGAGSRRSGTLASAQSPSVARPDNRSDNAALRHEPPFTTTVSFHPVPSCPKLRLLAESGKRADGTPLPGEPEGPARSGRAVRPDEIERSQRVARTRQPHLTTADVWEEVHRRTGLPVITDSYTRLYDPGPFTGEKALLFEALCRTADELGVRWRKDGDFLLARSTSFFWDKLKEVPRRDLQRWQLHKTERHGLPFDDLVEMALLTDQQLDSKRVGAAVSHCWDLPEWELLGSPVGFDSPRPWLRWLAALSAPARKQALSIEGLPLAILAPAAQQEALALMGVQLTDARPGLKLLAETRVRFGYAPAGSYEWVPELGPTRDQNRAAGVPVVSAPTAEAALASARRADPSVRPEEIQKSDGTLCVTLLPANAAPYNAAGRRAVQFRLSP